MENISFDEKGIAARAPDPSPRHSAHTAQLRLGVEARMEELEKTLTELAGESDRGRTLTASLQTARNYLRAGWDRISEAEAAQLSYWLKTTEDLIVTSPGMKALKQA